MYCQLWNLLSIVFLSPTRKRPFKQPTFEECAVRRARRVKSETVQNGVSQEQLDPATVGSNRKV